MLKHSLLSDGVFHATTPQGAVASLSLPQVLAALSRGESLDFTGLRPHQRGPWHAFAVQLACLALVDEDDPVIPIDADAWAEKLRVLTPAYPADEPWHLLSSDWQTPAFLQAPCSVARVADFKRSADAAQDIDVLVTARHHDEKSGKLPFSLASLDTLVYALVTLQGFTPGLGRGNYNSMRVNGGYGSRSQFRLALERGTGAEFRRDLSVLLETRDRWLDEAYDGLGIGTATDPHKLLWLAVWDDGALALADVHPMCLEVCRRVRLVEEQGHLLLRRASSDTMRVAAKDLHGAVGDPWAPVMLGDEVKVLTAQSYSLGYRSLHTLLFDRSKVRLPLLALPSESERSANHPATLIAQVLVSGDGGTDGLLRRELTMPSPILTRLVSEPERLAQRSQRFVELAGLAAGKVLRGALLQFIDDGDEVEWKNRDFVKAVEPWMARFDAAVDEAFFGVLFDSLTDGLADDDAARIWVRWLADACRRALDEAAASLPTRGTSRWFAHERARRLLRFGLRKQFGPLLAPGPGDPVPAAPVEETQDG